jgi:DNA-binding transcriptional MerR regulator
MISSKDLIYKTGISRATLNNYINLGILSKPTVLTPADDAGGAKLLGYFPDWSLDRIELVQRLKAEGFAMAEIAARIVSQTEPVSPDTAAQEPTAKTQMPSNVRALDSERRVLQLSIDDIPHPAYMVNYSFELAWYNDLAREQLLAWISTRPNSPNT